MKNIKVCFKFLKITFMIYKPYYFFLLIVAIITSSQVLFNVYSVKVLMDALTTNNYDHSLLVGGIIVLINLLFHLFSKYQIFAQSIFDVKMINRIHFYINKKMVSIPYQNLENPEFLDLKERALFAIYNQNSVYMFINDAKNILQNGVTLISIFIILVQFDWLILLVLVVSVALSALMNFLSARRKIHFYLELLPINRRFFYMMSIVSNTSAAKDFRLYDMDELILDKYNKYIEETIRFFKKIERSDALFTILSNCINYICSAASYLLVALKVIALKLGIANFSFYSASAIQFGTTFRTLLDSVVDFQTAIAYVEPLVQILDIQDEKDEANCIPLEEEIDSIRFDHVSFHYPRCEELVLDDISFSIKNGEKISIVGLNGAGKTTIVKLITRLYKPTKGTIYLNGKDINTYQYDDYIKQIAAVFQDYRLFAYSIKDNISSNSCKTEEENERLLEAIKNVGLNEKIDSLPDGVDSLYSKKYDENGIELSGGETQKIAIARAIYKNSSLIILDEPTSALDPLAEADIYMNFNKLVKTKTAIYISHRMSSSVFCDKILLIEKGKVVAFLPHIELMKDKEGLYYKMFNSQAKNYAK